MFKSYMYINNINSLVFLLGFLKKILYALCTKRRAAIPVILLWVVWYHKSFFSFSVGIIMDAFSSYWILNLYSFQMIDFVLFFNTIALSYSFLVYWEKFCCFGHIHSVVFHNVRIQYLVCIVVVCFISEILHTHTHTHISIGVYIYY